MIDRELRSHAAEFRRAMDTNKYEVSEQGIYFPAAKVFVQGVYTHDVNGADERVDSNLVVDEGLTHVLDVVLKGGTQITTWYHALYAANYTPLNSLTAASFPATATEITSGTEGYTEATRRTWVGGSISGNAVDNTASKAAFTIATASSLAVNGAAVLSVNTKGSTSGKLLSAVKFSATRTLYDTDVFNLSYRLALTSA